MFYDLDNKFDKINKEKNRKLRLEGVGTARDKFIRGSYPDKPPIQRKFRDMNKNDNIEKVIENKEMIGAASRQLDEYMELLKLYQEAENIEGKEYDPKCIEEVENNLLKDMGAFSDISEEGENERDSSNLPSKIEETPLVIPFDDFLGELLGGEIQNNQLKVKRVAEEVITEVIKSDGYLELQDAIKKVTGRKNDHLNTVYKNPGLSFLLGYSG